MIPAMNQPKTRIFAPAGKLPAPKKSQAAYSPSFLNSGERGRLERLVDAGGSLGVLFIQIHDFRVIENLFGVEIASKIADLSENILATLCRMHLPGADPVFVERLEPGKCLVAWRDEGLALPDVLPDLALAFRIGLRAMIKPEVVGLTGKNVDVSVGYSVLTAAPGYSLEHRLYNALCEAQRIAESGFDAAELSLMREFLEIVERPLLTCVYQPIVDLRSGEVFAWEALARTPAGSHFASPTMLFDFAEEAGRIFSLEKTCRETAIKNFGPAGPGQKLFLNIHPRTMADPAFHPGETKALLDKYAISPSGVVLEITERHSTRDFALFHRTLDHYRRAGYKIAVDDVGTGYSGLYSIAEIRPEFIKIDMSLIRGIDTNPVKRALIETFITFSDRVGCKIIAEGVETPTELSCLVSLGVHYGQGYHLARPDYPKPLPLQNVAGLIVRAGTENLSVIKCGLPIGELSEPSVSVPRETPVPEVKRLMDQADNNACVVLKGVRPAGLIMSHHLNKLLSSQYGASLYAKRDASRIMDREPLIVDAMEPVENVSKAAMSREKFKVYDHIVVTKNGEFTGTVTVQKMLDSLARLQVELAKGANPLTGLPGNMAIDREIEARTTSGKHCSFIYADLDNFKVYNDTYGFHEGDQIILLTARILAHAVRRHGGANDFIGHVGGDDFVVATAPETAEAVCASITRLFGRLVAYRYSIEDRRRGAIFGKDRNGVEGEFPLVAISLAIIDCHGQCSVGAVAHRAAEMKKFAKSKAGNVFVRDRRSLPLPTECGCAPEKPSDGQFLNISTP
ncbi:MAG: EAL domain-containing protein [Desulfovibrionaceae bacterium]|nr:EAL domain-containing protein [Desulfovibrionaceae bacterium]MBF0514209.1 EAL domain-containing protein [Desulfovibrionaceae bacterium]